MIEIFKSKIVRQIPKTIYHYTSYDNFLNILESDEIWANSIKFQNDSEEFFEFIDLLSTEIQKSIEIFYNNNKISEKTYDLIEIYLKDKESFFFTGNYLNDHFLISFSTIKDELPLWNQYTEKNEGISIGFDAKKLNLRNLAVKAFNGVNINPHYFGHCWYNSQEKLEVIQAYAEKIILTIENSKIINTTLYDYDSKLSNEIKLLSPFFKKEFYKYENEYRLVFFKTSDKKIRKSKYGLSTYIVGLNNLFTFVNEIIIGPSSNACHTFNSLVEYITQKFEIDSKDIILIPNYAEINSLNVSLKIRVSGIKGYR